MAVEVRQGGLQWEAGIDTSKLEQDAQRIEQEFEKINQKQKVAENNLRNAIGKNLGSVVRAAREEFAGLSPEIQRTQTYLATLSSEIRNVDAAEKNLSRAFQDRKSTRLNSSHVKIS